MAQSRPAWARLAVLALGACALSAVAARAPELALAGAGAFVLLGLGLSVTGSPPRLFLAAVAVVLTGYAFGGRAFAYLGMPPVFVGEFVLGLGLIVAIARPQGWAFSPWGVTVAIVGYMVWGLIRTVPYLGTYGFPALRDGAAWAYALFALLVCKFVSTEGVSERVAQGYARLSPWLVVWGPLALLLDSAGIKSPFLTMKPGDLAVHLAGLSAFFLTGLYGESVSKSGPRQLPERLFYLFWLLACVFVLFSNRGGTLAILTALSVVLLLRPRRALGKVAWMAGIILVASLLLVALDLKVEIRGRETSARQVANIFLSVGGKGPSGGLEDTRTWRLLWWGKIWDYTVHGPYFWTGKGFGINLANDDGFQVVEDESLRAPHNAALTVLARSGVPGLATWLLVHLTFGIGMVRAYRRALRAGAEHAAHLHLWILAYWVAALVNSSFDVYLEGPQGAIWFWSIVGFGMAVQRESEAPVAMRPAGMPQRVLAASEAGWAAPRTASVD